MAEYSSYQELIDRDDANASAIQQREERGRVAIAGDVAGPRPAQWLPSQMTIRKNTITANTRRVARCHESGLSPATSPVWPFTRNR